MEPRTALLGGEREWTKGEFEAERERARIGRMVKQGGKGREERIDEGREIKS